MKAQTRDLEGQNMPVYALYLLITQQPAPMAFNSRFFESGSRLGLGCRQRDWSVSQRPNADRKLRGNYILEKRF